MVHSGNALPPENGVQEPTGISLLMGADLPYDNRLIGFSVSRTIGDEPGFAVELDSDTVDGQQRVSFWMTEDAGRRLGAFLADPTEPTAVQGL
jgi:hypothetical protein